MVQRIQKAKSRHEFEREERLASDTLGGGGNKKDLGTNVAGAGTRTNTGRGAENVEPEDYDEDDMRMLGGTPETGETASIKAGTYEEDYGGGVQGRRTEGQTGTNAKKPALPQDEKTIAGAIEDLEDFPTGKWSRQKARARISSTPENAKARKEPSDRRGKTHANVGRGNGVRGKGPTGSLRPRNAQGTRPRRTGPGGKQAAWTPRPPKGGRAARRGAAGGKARLGPRKNVSTPTTARRKTVRNEGV